VGDYAEKGGGDIGEEPWGGKSSQGREEAYMTKRERPSVTVGEGEKRQKRDELGARTDPKNGHAEHGSRTVPTRGERDICKGVLSGGEVWRKKSKAPERMTRPEGVPQGKRVNVTARALSSRSKKGGRTTPSCMH